MSIPQPRLDDRTYADLLEEALALIPSLAPQWTNHNPTDPGITLVELFAWLTEMLIYRIDRLPEENTRTFLRLLNGLQWTPGPDLDEDVRATVLDLQRRHRAVTAEDYELLAREASPGVARAKCLPRRNLAATNETDRLVPREGYVSLIVVPFPASQPGAPLPSRSLLDAVRGYLEPRRLMTVRNVVVGPVYVPIGAELVVATRPDVHIPLLRGRIVDALKGFLDPLTGGPEKDGWPFGRDVYVSEIYRLLEKVPGVDYVPDVTLSAASELWHEEGDPIGVELLAHHLPWAQLDPPRIAIGSAFLPVHVAVEAKAAAGIERAAAMRAAKAAVKLLFHPLHGGPGGTSSWEITANQIAAKVVDLSELETVASVSITADPSRLFEAGGTTAVRFAAGEMADTTVTIEL